MYRRNVSKRQAFTLVELLVVIAIIGILVGLLLQPFKQLEQLSLGRIQCANNVKQIVLACHNFESTYRLPAWTRSWCNNWSNWAAANTAWFGTLPAIALH